MQLHLAGEARVGASRLKRLTALLRKNFVVFAGRCGQRSPAALHVCASSDREMFIDHHGCYIYM